MTLDRDRLRLLPREVRVRLRDLPRHLRALRLALSRTTIEQLEAAMTSADEEVLIAEVYPVERSFELIDNYIGELAEIALESVAEAVGDGVENRRRLATIGAVSGALAERLVDVHRNRNALQHAYPDVAAAGIYEAAAGLADDVPRFLDQYLRWFPTEP